MPAWPKSITQRVFDVIFKATFSFLGEKREPCPIIIILRLRAMSSNLFSITRTYIDLNDDTESLFRHKNDLKS